MSTATARIAPECSEAAMGRTDWTPADYREEGRRAFDRAGFKQGFNPWQPSNREHFADSYMMIACPPAKRKASVAARNAEFGA